jgi:hypothetical protein
LRLRSGEYFQLRARACEAAVKFKTAKATGKEPFGDDEVK